MCKEKARTILQEEGNELTGWDRAIYDAEQKIQATKSYLSRLKVAHTLFKEKKESGEPFPGEASETFESTMTFEAKPVEGVLRYRTLMGLRHASTLRSSSSRLNTF